MKVLRGFLLYVLLAPALAGLAIAPATEASAASSTFSTLDQYAVSTPATAERTLDSLAAYLLQPAHTDTEKARLPFAGSPRISTMIWRVHAPARASTPARRRCWRAGARYAMAMPISFAPWRPASG